jgi:hypothetical protein
MKKLLTLVTLLLLCSDSFGWTINNSARRGFNVNEITIDISNNDCNNAGYTASGLKDMIQEVIDDYWNTVSSSALELKIGSIVGTDISSATSLTTVADAAAANHILIGCNDSIATFSNGSILGLGGIQCSSSSCQGAIAINDASGTAVASQSKLGLHTIIAHELGHALGLGHTSVDHALMYYSISGKEQEYLAQDDIDGISYLYPHESEGGGLLGSCGSIAFIGGNDNDGGNHPGPMSLSLLAILLLLFTVLMRPKKSLQTIPVRA